MLPLADLLLVNIAVLVSLWIWTLRDDFRVFDTTFVLSRTHWFLAISTVWLLLAAVQGFYAGPTMRTARASLTTLFGITAGLILIYFAVYFFAPRDNTIPRGTILSIAGISFPLVGAWRLGYIALTAELSVRQLVASLNPRSRRSSIPDTDSRETAPPPEDAIDQVLTVQEVAERLKVSQATIWRWCQSGKLPAFRVGHQWRIRASDLGALMHDNGQEIGSS